MYHPLCLLLRNYFSFGKHFITPSSTCFGFLREKSFQNGPATKNMKQNKEINVNYKPEIQKWCFILEGLKFTSH